MQVAIDGQLYTADAAGNNVDFVDLEADMTSDVQLHMDLPATKGGRHWEGDVIITHTEAERVAAVGRARRCSAPIKDNTRQCLNRTLRMDVQRCHLHLSPDAKDWPGFVS
jgi:hypothetical protein